ncbi:hypothetical protein [Sphingobacterium yanglingense]|uniref:Uncharacterized protein n=1 Tax=Sphingobacterium yanglingense TaxID=1437280 RepID=A0A4R6WL85_9SPHI|nr:hypothetical protein [Sphingobacterium yanglingense]TDQ79538.1 hypothetical protein CLV99_0980 [Sphingobacterium yanglingense]
MRETITTNATVNTARKVTKVKLTKGKTLDVTFEEIVTIIEIVEGEEVSKTISGDYTRIGKNIVHEDMENALLLLRSHLSILCDQAEAQGKGYYDLEEDEEALSKYKVSSYSIGGHDIHEGVTLRGVRFGKSGAPLNLNSPFTKWEGGDNEEVYENSFELRGLINHCSEEALLYVEGKMAPTAQLDMFEQAESDEHDTEDGPF